MITVDLEDGDLIHYKVNQYDVETDRILGGWGGTVEGLEELEKKQEFPPHSSERLHTVFGVKYVTRTVVCSECFERQNIKLPESIFECENCKSKIEV